jgi:hypothetical protein
MDYEAKVKERSSMKIGYARLTMNIEMNIANAILGNAEGRISLLKAIVEAGWDLTLYSQLSLRDEEDYHNKTMLNEFVLNNKWYYHVKYKPDKPVDSNTDLLIIESGPDNWLYNTRYNRQKAIRRCADVMSSYFGPVFIFNTDCHTLFPLHKIGFSPIQYSDRRNKFRLGKKGQAEAHGWADYEEIFENKKLIIFNQTHDQKAYLDTFDRARQQYRYMRVKCYNLPIVYDLSIIPRGIRDRHNADPFHGLIYLGFPRQREKEFEELYLNSGINNIEVWGPWNKKKYLEKKTYWEKEYGLQVHGFLPRWVLCPMTYYKSLMCVTLSPKRWRGAGLVTHRVLEAIHGGCLTLGIKEHKGIENYLDDEFLVESGKEVGQWFRKAAKMPIKKRFDILDQQFDKIKKYNGMYMLKYLMKVYRRENR